MSFVDDDDDDTDDDRLTSIRKLRRPMSIFNYPTPAGANSSSNNALYGRYQGMRSVSSLQKPAGVLQHPQRRSVSLLNGYPDHLKYRLESDRPSSRTGRKSSLGAGGGEDTAADMFNELDLIKERMQRLNAGTSSGRATPQPINHTATVGVATTPVTSSANINFASSSTTVPSDRLFQRRSSLTNTQPGSDYYRSARTATMPLALPVMSPNSPLARAPMANPIDFVPPDRTPTSLSQHHLQSVLARLGDCVDIDSLLIDRACSDLLRVYPTTTTPQQREALDQVCLSMANFVIKMLDDGQKQQNDFECEQQQEQQLQDQQQQQQQQHHHHHQLQFQNHHIQPHQQQKAPPLINHQVAPMMNQTAPMLLDTANVLVSLQMPPPQANPSVNDVILTGNSNGTTGSSTTSNSNSNYSINNKQNNNFDVNNPNGLSVYSPTSSSTTTVNNNAMNAGVSSTTVFVGGLNPNINELQLFELFKPFGTITDVKIPPGKQCGFVKYNERLEAEAAINGLQGFIIMGSPIRLSWGRLNSNSASASNATTTTAPPSSYLYV